MKVYFCLVVGLFGLTTSGFAQKVLIESRSQPHLAGDREHGLKLQQFLPDPLSFNPSTSQFSGHKKVFFGEPETGGITLNRVSKNHFHMEIWVSNYWALNEDGDYRSYLDISIPNEVDTPYDKIAKYFKNGEAKKALVKFEIPLHLKRKRRGLVSSEMLTLEFKWDNNQKFKEGLDFFFETLKGHISPVVVQKFREDFSVFFPSKKSIILPNFAQITHMNEAFEKTDSKAQSGRTQKDGMSWTSEPKISQVTAAAGSAK